VPLVRSLRTLIAVSTLVILGLPASVARAGTNVWTSQGPQGGLIASLAIDPSTPSTLYAGTTAGAGDGVFKTTNAGTSWAVMDDGLPSPAPVVTIIVDPASPSTIYAGLDELGVYRSTDGGGSWSARSNGLSGRRVFALAIDSASGALYAGTDAGVFKSPDAGSTWTQTSLTAYVEHLADDPTNRGTLYAGTPNTGMYKTTNGGTTWAAINSGIPLPTTVRSVAVAASAPATVYAGAETNGSSVFYRTSDGGGTWTATSNVGAEALAVSPVDPLTVYAAVYGILKSTDGGSTWTRSLSGTTGCCGLGFLSIVIDPSSPSTVYAGASGNGEANGPDGGVFKTTNSGGTWMVVNEGITNTAVLSVAVDASGLGVYEAGSGTGLVSSPDGGTTWGGGLVQQPNQPPQTTYQKVVAAAPSQSGTAYAVESVTVGYKTTDGGATWADTAIGSATNCGSASTIFAVAVKPTSASVVYVGTRCPSRHIMKTTDGGSTWTAMGNGLPHTLTISALVIDPSVPATVYAGTSNGLYKTTNGGSSWAHVAGGIDFNALAIDPVSPSTLFGVDFSGVIKSTNSGTTWTRVLSTPAPMRAVSVVPSHHNVVLAGGDGGIFLSTDGGSTWNPLDTGLTCLEIRALAVNSAGTALHAGTSCGGVFDFTFG